jgi:hypothetical protein
MWQLILTWVITTVISSMLAPKPKGPDNAQPGQIGDKDLPIASMEAPIPVLFGTRVLSGPNVVWYGDVQIRPIRKSSGGKK